MSKLDFVAFVYEDDYLKIQELVQQYPNIETGGDLFGLWKDERTVVIQLIIGPGKESVRTTTSFHQDVEYLQRVGSLITTEEGLCNVGEWHSHHQIGMPKPSAADLRTVFNNMPHLGLERFVLFIATIETGIRSQGKTTKRPYGVKPEHVKLHSFLFLGPTQEVLHGDIKIIYGKNPHRIRNRAINEIKEGAELPPSEQPLPRSPKSRNSDEESVTASVQARAVKDIQEKVAEKPTRQTEEKKPRPDVRRETKPRNEGGAVHKVQKHRDKEGLHTGGKRQNDQQYGRQVEDQSTSKDREKRSTYQTQRTSGFNNENVSPNLGSAPTNCGIQSNASSLLSQSSGVPSDSQHTGQTAEGSHDTRGSMDTTSFFREQMPQRPSGRVGDVGKMFGGGYF